MKAISKSKNVINDFINSDFQFQKYKILCDFNDSIIFHKKRLSILFQQWEKLVANFGKNTIWPFWPSNNIHLMSELYKSNWIGTDIENNGR